MRLAEIQRNCEETFFTPRNRTLELFNIYARKQQKIESLRQFWNVLTGIATRCLFEDQTDSLNMDAFIQNMNNRTVQQKLCTEPKENHQETFRFAVALEKGLSQQKSYKGIAVKTKPVLAVN